MSHPSCGIGASVFFFLQPGQSFPIPGALPAQIDKAKVHGGVLLYPQGDTGSLRSP